jgi:hypothetical protein
LSAQAESAAEVEPATRTVALTDTAAAAHSLLKVVHWLTERATPVVEARRELRRRSQLEMIQCLVPKLEL